MTKFWINALARILYGWKTSGKVTDTKSLAVHKFVLKFGAMLVAVVSI